MFTKQLFTKRTLPYPGLTRSEDLLQFISLNSCQHMKRAFTICSFVYLIILIVLSFTWEYLQSGNRNMKGDDFFFCFELVAVFTFIYLVILKCIFKMQFPWPAIIFMPVLMCIVSMILLAIMGISLRLNDYQSLRLYFYLHGIITVVMVRIILKYFIRKSLQK